MTTEKQKIIEIFTRKFINPKVQPSKFSEILDMSPGILKNCTEEDVAKLKKHKIMHIRSLGKIKVNDIEKMAQKMEIDKDQLRKWILASNLISRAWQKRSHYLKKKEIKICVLGLDNAGKTSMLESLSGRTELGEITDLEPTRGVDIRKIESENFNWSIWDFGGQAAHRFDYFENPEEYFLQLDLLIFVIDMQDSERYNESIEYFEHIVEILEFLNEKPYYLMLLHKSDPDQRVNSDFQLNLDFIREISEKNFEDIGAQYEIVESSIYNAYANEPEFAKTFKSFFGKKEKQKSIEESIQDLSEMIIKLSHTMMQKIETLEKTVQNALNSSTSSESFSKNDGNQKSKLTTPTVLAPPPPPKLQNKVPKPVTSQNIAGNRLDLMSELKEIFRLRQLTNE